MRLIDADALKVYHGVNVGANHGGLKAIVYKKDIDSAPTIDQVKHGKWIKDGESCALYKCSECNDLCAVAGYANCIPEQQMYKVFKFCPNCGAKMERSEE
jgi:hypothetical protein